MVLTAREHLTGPHERQYLWPVPAVTALFYPAALFALYRSFDLYRVSAQASDRLLSALAVGAGAHAFANGWRISHALAR
jgi:hypothetical protein